MSDKKNNISKICNHCGKSLKPIKNDFKNRTMHKKCYFEKQKNSLSYGSIINNKSALKVRMGSALSGGRTL